MRFLTILAEILTAMETATVAAVTSAVVKMVLQTEKCKHKQSCAARGFALFCFSCRNMPHGSQMFQTGRNQPPASSCQGPGTLLSWLLLKLPAEWGTAAARTDQNLARHLLFYNNTSERPDPTWSAASRSSPQERCGSVGGGPKEGHKEYSKSGSTILQRQAVKAEVVQPGVEKALGRLYYGFPVP